MTSLTKRPGKRRRGVASVEFAVVAPLFVTIVMGVAQVSQLFDVQNELAIAAREGARLASMDRTGMLDGQQTTNEKITADIKNFLTSNGLSGDDVNVHIVDPDDHVSVFDFDDPNNDLELFELRVELPYSSVSGLGGSASNGLMMSAKVVFRNARSVIVQ